MRPAIFTSAKGERIGVERAPLLDELDVRIYIAAALAVVLVVSFLTFVLEVA